jgi:hypothetical protein
MYKIQVIAQMGVQFAGYLLKNDEPIGGIGNDSNGFYVKLEKELTVRETMALMSYIPTLNADFGDIKIQINNI